MREGNSSSSTRRAVGDGILTLDLILLVAATAFAAVYLWVGLQRVFYPYFLDLVEENMLMQALRQAQGKPIYLPANAEFVPQVYMPLYTWLGGIFFNLVEPAFWPLRLLSFGATLVIAGEVALINRGLGVSRVQAWGSGALFLAGYRIAGGWYDLARVDPLFVGLALAGMALAAHKKPAPGRLALAGLLMGLSFTTKQNGLFLGMVVGAYLLLQVGVKVWPYVLSFAAAGGLPIFLLARATDGRFLTYTFDIAYASPIAFRRLGATLLWEIGLSMAGLLLLLSLALTRYAGRGRWGGRQKRQAETRRALRWPGRIRALLAGQPWFTFIGAAGIVSLAGRSSVGGNLNNLIPAYALLCLGPGLVTAGLAGGSSRRLGQVIVTAMLAQFVLSVYSPAARTTERFLPGPEMRASGERFVARLSRTEGEVWVMMHPTLTLQAGKMPTVHVQSLWHARHRGQDPPPADLVERVRGREYALIVSDHSVFFEQGSDLLSLVERYYEAAERLEAGDAPQSLSGLLIRPQVVYRPKDSPR